MTTLFSADELLQGEFPQRYLLDPVVPLGGRVLFHGKRETGKTQFALSLALCIISGGRLWGRYPVTPGPVVFVQVDMTESIQQDRLLHASRVFPDIGKMPLYFWMPPSVNIVRLKEDDEAVQQIKEIDPVLIVWDALREIHGMEDSDIAAKAVYGASRVLFPRPTNAFIHHDKKTIPDQAMLDPSEVFHGSGFWLNNVDTGLHVKRQGGNRLFTFTKIRTAERSDHDPVLMKIDPESILMFQHMGPIKEEAARWRAEQTKNSDERLLRHLVSSLVGPPGLVKRVLKL